MAGRIPEQNRRAPGSVPSIAERQRAGADHVVSGLSDQIVWPGQPIREERKVGNAILLLTGEHGGFRLSAGGELRGSPGTRVTRPASLAAAFIVSDITFEAGVALAGTADVLFRGCTFLLPLTVAIGGLVVCDGCRFDGTSAITNLGAILNAKRTGCSGTSALAADLGVTITGGV